MRPQMITDDASKWYLHDTKGDDGNEGVREGGNMEGRVGGVMKEVARAAAQAAAC